MSVAIGKLQEDGSVVAVVNEEFNAVSIVGLLFSKPPEEIVKDGKHYSSIKEWMSDTGVLQDRYLHGYEGIDDYFLWRWLLLQWDPIGVVPSVRSYNIVWVDC